MNKLNARPLRSLLFTPGDQETRIAENAKSGADALFLDLEEPRTPCPESTRVQARGLVREFLEDAPDRPRRSRVLRASPAGRVGNDPARSPGGDGPEPLGRPPAQDHRPGRRARRRRDPRLRRDRARPARRPHAALPDPRDRERDPQRVRDRDGIAAGRVHGRRGIAFRRHRRRHRVPLDTGAAPRRCSSGRRCSSTRAPPAFGIRSAACGAARTTTSKGCTTGSPSSATSATSG